jgi:oxalate---CoA ligase
MELWLQYRGTELLSDPNPYSTVDWPIIEHIEFLRKHINKDAIRAGYVPMDQAPSVDLPADIVSLTEFYTVVEHPPTASAFDFMTERLVDEGREKLFQAIAFDPIVEELSLPPINDAHALAASALKVRTCHLYFASRLNALVSL